MRKTDLQNLCGERSVKPANVPKIRLVKSGGVWWFPALTVGRNKTEGAVPRREVDHEATGLMTSSSSPGLWWVRRVLHIVLRRQVNTRVVLLLDSDAAVTERFSTWTVSVTSVSCTVSCQDI